MNTGVMGSGKCSPYKKIMTKTFNFKNVKGLHLAHINICSLFNKIDIVKTYSS